MEERGEGARLCEGSRSNKKGVVRLVRAAESAGRGSGADLYGLEAPSGGGGDSFAVEQAWWWRWPHPFFLMRNCISASPRLICCGGGGGLWLASLAVMVSGGKDLRPSKSPTTVGLREGYALPSLPVIVSGVPFGTRESRYAVATPTPRLSPIRRRRHLTSAQKRALIADQLKDTPEKNNSQIGQLLGVSHNTVKPIREDLVSRCQIDNQETYEDSRGHQQPARKPRVYAVTEAEGRRAQKALEGVPEGELPAAPPHVCAEAGADCRPVEGYARNASIAGSAVAWSYASNCPCCETGIG